MSRILRRLGLRRGTIILLSLLGILVYAACGSGESGPGLNDGATYNFANGTNTVSAPLYSRGGTLDSTVTSQRTWSVNNRLWYVFSDDFYQLATYNINGQPPRYDYDTIAYCEILDFTGSVIKHQRIRSGLAGSGSNWEAGYQASDPGLNANTFCDFDLSDIILDGTLTLRFGKGRGIKTTWKDVNNNTQISYSLDRQEGSAYTQTIVLDRGLPAGGELTVNGNAVTSAGTKTGSSYSNSGSFDISLRTDFGDNQGSGMASSILKRESANLVGDNCGAYSQDAGYENITGALPIAQGPGQGITRGKCYRYTLTGTDNAGNSDSISTVVIVPARQSGSLLTWGAAGGSSSMQLGSGAGSPDVYSPTRISTSLNDWDDVSAGSDFGLAIRAGRLYSWGANATGRTGQGTASGTTNTPTQIGTDSDWQEISAGVAHGLAIKNGQLYGWGNNGNGHVGNNGTVQQNSPVLLDGGSTGWTDISAGNQHSLAIRNGQLYAWGSNTNGRTGRGTGNTTGNTLVPTLLDSGTTGWTKVSAGQDHSLAIRNGELYAFGANASSQLGNGLTTDLIVPTKIGSLTSWTDISAGNAYSLGVQAGGLYAWGSNTNGRTGRGTTTGTTTSPTQVGALTTWTRVSAGAGTSMALEGGKLYTWGLSTNGRLGNGTVTPDVSAPTQIGSRTDWRNISAGIQSNYLAAIASPSADTTAPTGGAVTINGTAATTGGVLAASSSSWFSRSSTTINSRTNWTDGAALASSLLIRESTTISNGTCGTSWSSSTLVSGTTTQSGLSTGCYRYTLIGTDEAGNTASVQATVKVDTTAPNGGSVTSPAWASNGAFTVTTTNFTDADSGMTSNTLERSSATLNSNGTCGTFGSYSATTTSQSGLANGCYQYRLVGTNALSYTNMNTTITRVNSSYTGAWSEPANAVRPSFSGTTASGSALSGNEGTWSGTPVPTTSYQWQRCSASNTTAPSYVSQLSSGLLNPAFIATDTPGNVYVSDGNHFRIRKFSPSGSFILDWGGLQSGAGNGVGNGNGDGAFNANPAGIATDSLGNVYVADVGNNRVQKFDSNGKFLTKWGTSGTGNGQFGNVMSAIAVDASNNVYVAEAGTANRIQVFNSSGIWLKTWTGFNSPISMAFDSSSNIYIVNQGASQIRKFPSLSAGGAAPAGTTWGSSGTGDGQFTTPRGIAIDSSDNVYVTDLSGGGRIQKFNSSGSFLTKWGSTGTGNGQFTSNAINGIAIDKNDNIYVSDSSANRIQEFSDCTNIAGATSINYTLAAADETNQVRLMVTGTSQMGITERASTRSATITAPAGDSTPPSISSFTRTTPTSSPTNATTISYQVQFSESVTGFIAGDISLAPTSTSTYTWTPSNVQGSGTTWTFDMVRSGTGDNGTVIPRIAANSVQDGALNNGPTALQDGPSTTVDYTAPSSPSLTLSGATGNTFVDDTNKIAYINAQAGRSGSFDIAATSSDAETGIKNIIFPGLTGFTAPGNANITDTSSPYSTTYNWSGAVTASGSQTVTATNNADGTATSTFTVTPDTTAPSAGTITAPAYDTDGTFNVTFTGGSDAGSGVASNVLTRETGTLSGDVCSAYGAASASLGSSPVSQTSLTTGCYRYTLTTTDNVGNTNTTTQVVKVDPTAPSNPSLTLSGATGNTFVDNTNKIAYINAQAGRSGSFDIAATSSDAETGIKNIIFPGLTGFTAPGNTQDTDTTSPYGRTYSWSGAAGASGSQTVTATNGADGTATSTFTVTPDTTAPTGGSINAPAYDTDGNFSVTWGAYSDAESGISTNSITRQAGTLSGDSCSAYGTATDITSSSPISQNGLNTGCYRYTLTGTDRVGNTVSASTVVEVKVDTSAPAAPSLTLSGATGNTFVDNTNKIAYINAQAGRSGSFDIAATSSDADTSIKNIIFPGLTGFTAPGNANITDSSSPYSNTYSWSGAVGASGSQTVTVTNNADNTATSTFTVTPDTTAPSAGSITAPNYDTDGTFNVTFTGGSDAGSGVASNVLTRETGTLSGDSCSSYGSPSSNLGSSPVSQTSLTVGCYRYTLTTTDNVGNTNTTTQVVKVDPTAPSNPSLTLSGATGNTFVDNTNKIAYINAQAGRSGSFDIAATSSDAETGIKNIIFPGLTGFTAPGNANITDTTSPYSNTYSWSGAVTASGSQTVTATNNADGTATSTFTVTPDTTNPSAGSITAPAYDGDGTFNVTFTGGSDAGSGVASNVLTRETGTLSGDSCSAYGTASASLGSSPVSQTSLTVGCYRYTLTTTDNVGNTNTTTQVVKVDPTAPSNPSLTLSGATGNTFISGTQVYINAQAGRSGSFDIAATSSDAQSGIKNIIFPGLTGFTAPGNANITDTTSPYSNTYSWSGAVTASGSQTVTATNNADGTATSTFTVTPDTTNPSAGSITAPAYDGDGTFNVTFTGGSDAGSGVASNVLTRETGTLSGDSCSSYGSPSSNLGSSPVSQSSLTAGCYRYTLTTTDNVGNTNTTTQVVKMDPTAPTGGSVSSPATNSSGTFTVTVNNFSDDQSGMASNTLERRFVNPGAGQSCPADGDASWGAWATTSSSQSGLADGCYQYRLRGTNNAGNESTSSSSTTRVNSDTTAPTLTLEQAAGQADPANSAPINFTFSSNENLQAATVTASDFQLTAGTGTISVSGSGSSYTVAVASPSQGNITIAPSGTFAVQDTAGNSQGTIANGSDRTVTFDSVAPFVSSFAATNSPTNGNVVNYSVTFSEALQAGSFTAADYTVTGTSTGTITKGEPTNTTGNTWTFSVTRAAATDGTVIATITSASVSDTAGNTGPATDQVATGTIDKTAPASPSISAQPSNPSNATSASFSFSGEGSATFRCSMDDSVYANATSCTSPRSYSGLSAGSHTFRVWQIDQAGNVSASPASYTWTIDTTAPTLTLEQAAGQADPANSAPINFTFSSNENLQAATVTASDFQLTAGTGTISVSGSGSTYTVSVASPSQGNITIAPSGTFAVQDTAGNSQGTIANGSDRTVTFDSVAPTLTLQQAAGQADPANSAPIQFTFSSNENLAGATLSASDFSVSNGSIASISPDPTTNNDSAYTIDVTPTDQGIISIAPNSTPGAFSVSDPAGNAVTNTLLVGGTDRSVTYDTVAPAAPTLTNNYTTTSDTTPTWSWTGAESGGTYQCKIDDGAWESCSSPFTASVLTEGNHTFRVRQIDAAGNVGSADVDNIAVDPFGVDTTAPSVGSITAPSYDTDGSFQVTFTGGSDAGSGVASNIIRREDGTLSGDACSAYGAPSASLGSSPVTQTDLASGCYRYTLTTTDNAGNTTTATSVVKVDKSFPTGGAISVPLSDSDGNFNVTYTKFTDSLSGIKTMNGNVIRRQRVAISNGSCPASGWENDGSPVDVSDASSPLAQSSLASGYCYRYIIEGTDRANNTSLVTSGSIKIDSSSFSLTLESMDFDPTGNSPLTFRLSSNRNLDFSSISQSDFTLSNGSWWLAGWIAPENSNSSDYFIYVQPTEQGVVSIAPSSSFSVSDIEGNNINNPAEVLGEDRSVTFDQSGPEVASMTRTSPASSPSSATELTYNLQFTENAFDSNGGSVDASAIGVSGTASGFSWNKTITGSGSNYTVTLNRLIAGATYENSLGSAGTSDGEFNAPYGITTDSSGNIYVADYNNNRIQKFSSSGTHLLTFGSTGTGNGELSSPTDVALDSSGNIYVADSGNNRIQKFSSSGNYISKIGAANDGQGSADGEFAVPTGLTVDSNDNLYVVDSGNNRVQKFSAAGTHLLSFGASQLNNPFGLAIDSENNVYVTNLVSNRVEKFSASGVYQSGFGSKGGGSGQLLGPTGISVDSSGKIYVVDAFNTRVQKFSAAGTYVSQFGSYGSGDGRFILPVGIETRGNNIYVADAGNNRISKFNNQEATPVAGTVVPVVRSGGVYDGANNIGPASDYDGPSTTISLDKPTATWSGTPASPSNNASLDYTLSFSENVTGLAVEDLSNTGSATGCTFSLAGSGDSYTVTISNCSEGTVVPRLAADSVINAGDISGPATAALAETVTIDRTAPATPTITSQPNNPSASASATFTFSGEGGATFFCSLDNASFASASTCSTPKSYDNLSEGSHTFRLWARDAAGNVSQVATYTWTIGFDSTPPTAPTFTAGPAGDTNNASPTFEWTGEAGGTYECKLTKKNNEAPNNYAGSGNLISNCTSPRQFSNLPEGAYTLEVRQTDGAGNVGPWATREFRVFLDSVADGASSYFALNCPAGTSNTFSEATLFSENTTESSWSNSLLGTKIVAGDATGRVSCWRANESSTAPGEIGLRGAGNLSLLSSASPRIFGLRWEAPNGARITGVAGERRTRSAQASNLYSLLVGVSGNTETDLDGVDISYLSSPNPPKPIKPSLSENGFDFFSATLRDTNGDPGADAFELYWTCLAGSACSSSAGIDNLLSDLRFRLEDSSAPTTPTLGGTAVTSTVSVDGDPVLRPEAGDTITSVASDLGAGISRIHILVNGQEVDSSSTSVCTVAESAQAWRGNTLSPGLPLRFAPCQGDRNYAQNSPDSETRSLTTDTTSGPWQEGANTVTTYAEQYANNRSGSRQTGTASETRTRTVVLDSTAPSLASICASPTGTGAGTGGSLVNSWYTTSVTCVPGTASDANGNLRVAGVENVQYQIDNGSFDVVADNSITLNNEGSFTLRGKARDRVGNETATANQPTRALKIDMSNPSISLLCNGTSPASGWYTSAPNCTPNASDSVSGVASSGVSLDNNTFTASVNVTTQGTNTVYARATDNAGRSANSSGTVRLDTSNPTLSAACSGGTLGSNGWYKESPTCTVVASDAVSGLAATEWVDSNGATAVNGGTYNFTQTLASGNTFQGRFRARDNAGRSTQEVNQRTIKLDGISPTALPQIGTVRMNPSGANEEVTDGTHIITGTARDKTWRIPFTENTESADGSAFQCIFDNPSDSSGTWTDCTETATTGARNVTNLDPGYHSLTVRRLDQAGNVAANGNWTTYTWCFDFDLDGNGQPDLCEEGLRVIPESAPTVETQTVEPAKTGDTTLALSSQKMTIYSDVNWNLSAQNTSVGTRKASGFSSDLLVSVVDENSSLYNCQNLTTCPVTDWTAVDKRIGASNARVPVLRNRFPRAFGKDYRIIYGQPVNWSDNAGVYTITTAWTTAADIGESGTVPINSSLPIVSPTANLSIGTTLTASTGSWIGNPSFRYQWQRTERGSFWSDIPGATNATYNLTSADFGKNIRLVILGFNDAGSTTALSSPVAFGSLVLDLGAPPRNTSLPTLSLAGSTLNLSIGTWSGTPAPGLRYTWQISTASTLGNFGNWTNISGYTNSTTALSYSPTQTNRYYRVLVEARNGIKPNALVQTAPFLYTGPQGGGG